jgi:flagellar assembly protein FliH
MEMPDSNQQSPPQSARPFLYAPPSGEVPPGQSGRASWAENDGQESPGEHFPSDQKLQESYERGFSEGKASARPDFEKSIAELRNQISSALRNFSKDRVDYFSRVEADVVRLSLSIARKILHRESQIDPLVLTGVVQVALQKLNSDTRVRLCAHPDEVRFWNDFFKQSKDIPSVVEVVGNPSLSQGQCTIETDLGSTQISLETQLKEIEQGFFDLLEQRPKGEQ